MSLPALGSMHDAAGVPIFVKCIETDVLIMKYPQQIAKHFFLMKNISCYTCLLSYKYVLLLLIDSLFLSVYS